MSEEKEQEEKDTELDLIAEQELLRLTRQFRVSYVMSYVIFACCMPQQHSNNQNVQFFQRYWRATKRLISKKRPKPSNVNEKWFTIWKTGSCSMSAPLQFIGPETTPGKTMRMPKRLASWPQSRCDSNADHAYFARPWTSWPIPNLSTFYRRIWLPT